LARRKVSVELELEVAAYVGKSTEAATVTRRVRSEVHELGDEVDETSHDLEQLAANATVAARQIDDVGDEALGTAAQLQLLRSRIDATSDAARRMGATFADVPDIPSQQGQPAALGGGGGDSGDADLDMDLDRQVVRTARRTTSTIGSAIGLIPGRLRGVLILAIVGAIVAAAPTIGAMLGGIVSGAVAVSGIGGGIAMASRDPRVRAAAKRFGEEISAEFFSGASSFALPTIASLDVLEDAFRALDLDDAFAKAAPHMTTLADGIGDFAKNIMPGLNLALDRSGPFVRELADGLSKTGTALSIFLDQVSEGEGTISGLHAAFNLINNTLIFTGRLINNLSDLFRLWIKESAMLFGVLEDLPSPLQDRFRVLNDTLEDMLSVSNRAAPEVRDLELATDEAAKAAEDAATAFEKTDAALTGYLDLALSLDEAQARVQQGFIDLHEDLKRGRKNWDENTQAGRDNMGQLRDQIGVILAARDAQIRATGAVGEANKTYETALDRLLRMAAAAGASKAQLEKLKGTYSVQVVIETIGLAAVRAAAEFSRQLSRFGFGFGGGRQHGGPVRAGELYEVNEGGRREFFRPAMDGYVTPLSAMQPMSRPFADGGAGPGRLHLTMTMSVRPGYDQQLADAVMRMIRIEVQSASGDVQTELGRN
jgi:hypothetical protein